MGLVVSVTAAPEVVAGRTYTNLVNSATLTPPFKTVTLLDNWRGTVAYTANSGKSVTISGLVKMPPGTSVFFR